MLLNSNLLFVLINNVSKTGKNYVIKKTSMPVIAVTSDKNFTQVELKK